MSRLILTIELARAAGGDAANHSMRKAGRTAWNEEDYETAIKEFDRLVPFLPAKDRFRLTGKG